MCVYTYAYICIHKRAHTHLFNDESKNGQSERGRATQEEDQTLNPTEIESLLAIT